MLRFAADLRKLRRQAGNPSYRQLAEQAHYSVTTLSVAANGQKLPSLAVTLAYVRACDGDVGEWEQRWRAVAAELARDADHVAPAEDGQSPYVGLAAFQVEDADRFFGRDRLVEEMVTRLSQRRFVAVFGASGAGKSSLLRAGLLPRWRTEKNRLVVLLTPGACPVAECAIHLARLTGQPAQQLAADLAADPAGLHRAIRAALAERPDDAELVIVVDQFEETFTLCQDETERARFIDLLTTAVRALNSRCRVVLGVRADFYTHCTNYPDLVAALDHALITVGPMTNDELRDAIVRPATGANCTLEGALLAELITHAARQAGALPMLSHALRETWRRRRGNTLTLAGYHATGGIDGALAHTAETVYTGLDADRQRQARDLFLRLTALGEGTEDTKRRINRSELAGTDSSVLDALAEARLITLAETTVEIAHEALIGAWPRLRQWLTEDRDGLRTQRRLTEDAQAWAALNRDSGALYRGVRLAVARDWASRDTHAGTLNPVERAFLDSSVELQERERAAVIRRNRQLRYLAIGLAVLLVGVTVVSVVAVRQREEAVQARQVAISRQLATQALAMIDSDPGVARLLSVEAFRTAPTMEARSALLSMSAHQEYVGEITAHDGAISELAFGPDGRTLFSVGRDRTVGIWDPARRRRIDTVTGHDTWLKALAMSPDGTTIATGGNDHQLVLWSAGSRKPLARLSRHTGFIRGIAFSPDSRTVATTSDDHTVMLWDVTSRTHLATLTGHTQAVVAVAISPDGRTVATVSDDRNVLLWDLASRTHIATLAGHPDVAVSVAFSPDGRTLATGGGRNAVLLWDVSSRTRIATLTSNTTPEDHVKAISFSPDGRTLATASTDRSLLLWDIPHRTQRAHLTGHQTPLYALAFHPTSTLLASAGEDGTIMLWDTARTPMTHPSGAVNDIAFSPNGDTLAAASTNTATLWDTTTREPQATVTSRSMLTRALAFSPNGHTIAMANSAEQGGRDGNTLTLWNPRRSAANAELTGHTHSPLDVAFSPDGRTVATASYDTTVILWDLPRRTQLATLDVGAIANGLAFSPNGRILAIADHDNRNVTLWDLATRTRTATLKGHSGWVRTVVFSPDGRTLASASADHTVIMWDVSTGKRLTRLTGFQDTDFTGVALSPNGNTLAFTGADHTVLLWDTQRREPIARLTGHTDNVNTLAFSPDNHTLASASADSTAILWDTHPERTAQRICTTLSRNLTQTQWAQFIGDLPYHKTCDTD